MKSLTLKIILHLILLLLAINLFAQKLPSIQNLSVYAPASIRIDGNANEWGDKFQAYNNATELFYTVANDQDNLYFTLRADYYGIIQKIAAGAIVFTLKSSQKGSLIAPVTFTYPVVPSPYDGGIGAMLRETKILNDTALLAVNRQMSGHIKDIPVSGLAGIADPEISIYNDLGIKAAGAIDKKKAYTCEVAVPLKYMRQVINANGTFNYKFQLNGLSQPSSNRIVVGGFSTGEATDAPVAHDSSQFLLAPTYCSGTYTLIKQ